VTNNEKPSNVEIQSFHYTKLSNPGISFEAVKACPFFKHILSFVIGKPCRYDENETNLGLYELKCIVSDLEMKFAHTLTCAHKRIIQSNVPSGF
jgi:hypothetical protein